MSSFEVVPLDAKIVLQLRTKANEALNGDGTCSLHTMRTSCFASESCARGRGAMTDVESLLQQDIAFVARDKDDFLGCVSGMRGRSDLTVARYFPEYNVHPDTVIVYNLCVSHASRGRGVGRALVEKMMQQGCAEGGVLLLVARGPRMEQSVDMHNLFSERVKRLLSTYRHMGFQLQRSCDECHLMRGDVIRGGRLA